jgi:hypothetical protein
MRVFTLSKLSVLALIVLVLSICSIAQEVTYENGGPSAHIKRPAGEIFVWYKEAGSTVSGRGLAYIQGTKEDEFAKRDAVKISVNYDFTGNRLLQPSTWYLELWSFSGNRLRFNANHWLKIIVGGKIILSQDLPLRSINPRGIQSQFFVLTDLPYKILLDLIKSDDVIFQIGEDKIPISVDVLKLLREQDGLIERADAHPDIR